ncbi:MAG: protein kinase domain-containing protein [Thermoanaerobaculia bacterium]
MPVILVIEQDERVPSRVRQALEPDGWKVVHARWVTEAMQAMAAEAPDLLLVAAQADGARDVLATYARRRGGPGTVALLPEPPSGGAGEAAGGDASLPRSFGADELRRVVRKILAGGAASPVKPSRDEPKLTSREIFGDLLAEVEEGPSGGPGESPAGAAAPPTPERPAPSDGSPGRDDGAAPAGPPPRPEPGAEGSAPAPRRGDRPAARPDDDIARKLERTLSGVLDPPAPGKKRPEARPGSGGEAPPRRPTDAGHPARRRRRSEDVDRLLSQTLSGLELPGERKKAAPRPPAPPAPTTPDRPSAPRRAPEPHPETGREDAAAGRSFELADLEALIEEQERRERSSSEGAPGPGPSPPAADDRPQAFMEPSPAAPPPPEAEPPGTTGSPPRAPEPRPKAPAGGTPPADGEPVGPGSPSEIPFQPLFGDAMEEMPDGAAVEPGDAGGAPEAAGQDSAEAPAGEAGGDFGQYQLLERIGVGGMAEVWKARMTGVEGFRKTVAIKRILPHLTDSSDFVDMFVDEAKLAAQLNHANIIHIYDLGKIGRDYYIAMEYVEGENLRGILNRSREDARPVPLGLALHVGARLASALDYAHRKRDFDDREMGLVHRDVSPQNVLVGYEGTIKLCDFGIVKAVSKSSHTRMGALKGKLQYMSPEQAWGRTVDGRSDVFSLGALIFEMLTGRRLFAGESEMEVLEAVRECRVVPPSEVEPAVPEAVDAVVLGALEADPDQRFQSAGELERRLDEILATMRPSPGQAELASYMDRLFRSDEPPAAAEPPGADPGGGSEPARESPSSPVTASASSEDGGAPPAPGAGGEDAAPAEGAEAPSGATPPPPPVQPKPSPPEPAEEEGVELVEPVLPRRPGEVEEGGSRGRGFLIAAIVVAVLAGAALAWWMANRQGALPWQDPGSAGPSAEAPPTPSEGSGAGAGGAADPPGPGSTAPERPPADAGADAAAGGAGEPGAAEGSAGSPEDSAGDPGPAGSATASDEELDQAVNEALEERLARQEKELRRQFESKEQELQQRLEALREEQRSAEEPDEPDEPDGP